MGLQRVDATEQLNNKNMLVYKVNSLPLFSDDTCAEMQVTTTRMDAKTVPPS